MKASVYASLLGFVLKFELLRHSTCVFAEPVLPCDDGSYNVRACCSFVSVLIVFRAASVVYSEHSAGGNVNITKRDSRFGWRKRPLSRQS